MQDEQIVELYWQRSDQAISETNQKYGRYCHAIAYNICGLTEDAEECVNDTWLRAWNLMPDQRPRLLSAFLGCITRNFAIDRVKAKNRIKRGGGEAALALDELEAFHRRLLPLVETVDYDYMEVSSPGVDRPLKTERDFEHAQGTTVEVKTYRAIDGSKQFVGDLIGLRGDEIVIQIGPDQEMAFHKKDVAVVREYIDFDESDLEDDVPVQ